MFLPAAHRLLRHSGDVETGEHLTTVLSRIKVEFIELADEGNAAEAPDVGVRNGKIAAQNFKQLVLPAPLSPTKPMRS